MPYWLFSSCADYEDLQSVKAREKHYPPNEFDEDSVEKVILQYDIYDSATQSIFQVQIEAKKSTY